MDEVWRLVPGCGGRYEASDRGRIRSLFFINGTTHRRRMAPSLLRPRLERNGYFRVSLSLESGRQDFRVNHVVCMAFNGPPPTTAHRAWHLDQDRANNRPANLIWETRCENTLRTCSIPEPNTGCILWTKMVNAGGYGVTTDVSDDGTSILAHRLAWILKHGPIPDDKCVLHRCDTPACINTDHHFLGTRTDNSADRDAKGRTRKYKLTAESVRRIRFGGEPVSLLTKALGVSDTMVFRIRSGLAWRHVGASDELLERVRAGLATVEAEG